MEYKDFIIIIKTTNNTPNKFKKYSLSDLCLIMGFLEQKLKSKSGNWSIRNINNLVKEIEASPRDIYFNLLGFYEEYSKRKKANKMFESLLNKYDVKRNKIAEKYYNKRYGKFELSIKDKKKIGEFLNELKKIKKDYINGLDEDFLEIVFKNIKTGYKKTTLRNYYYNY